MTVGEPFVWRRLPHLDFEYDLSAAELYAIYQDDHWGPLLKKLCQLAVHPNTPGELLDRLNREYLDDEYHSLQRSLWLRAQWQGISTDHLRAEVMEAILHQQLRYARISGQIKRDLAVGLFGMREFEESEAEEIASVIEAFAVLTNCSIPDPGDKVMLWLVSVAQDALEFARNELYFFYLLPESAARSFYQWAHSLHSQFDNNPL